MSHFRVWGVAAFAGAALCCAAAAFSQAGSSGYHLLHTYKFDAAPGATTEYFDYVTVDPDARRVYLGRGTAVEVMDADSGANLGFIPGFTRQHGVAIADEFNHGFISDGSAGKITVFDLKTLKPVTTVKADPDTDCMVYDPASKNAFSMNGDGNSSTVVNAKTGELVKTIPLGGAPEFAVADGKGTIYANLADKNVIAAIDTKTLDVKSRWPVAPAGAPTALAIDREHRRLFSAGRNPQTLVILDADSGKVIQSFPISAGTDAAGFDPATGLIFVSTIEGNLHIFHEDTPDKYSVIDTVKTEYGAKTMGVDTKTHQVYLDTADFSAPVAGTNGRGGRRTAVPGTFRVLVYGK
jgi:DNA-binding beta-propeller fold protein YncE